MDIIKQVLNNPEFFLVSLLAISGAFGVILGKNIIRAGFSLVVCFLAVAGAYFILKAPFVAASQILIYAVGITLIIVFALMLTSTRCELPIIKGDSGKNFLSAIISIGIFFVFSSALIGNKWPLPETIPCQCPKNTEVIGLKMLGTYALPFELISILLLVALIGAVVIAKKDKRHG